MHGFLNRDLNQVPLIVLLVVLLAGSAHAAEPAGEKEGPGAIEQKMVGRWRGGPCMGTIDFRADGTFDRTNYTPGGNRISGVWKIRWDALPPLLVMNIKTSDAPDRLRVGDANEARLAAFTDQEFRLAMPLPNAPDYECRFKRVEK